MKVTFYEWCIDNNRQDLIQEWHSDKNAGLNPKNVTFKSGRKVWWLGKCGHEWQSVVHSRTNGTGCPVCAGKQVVEGFNDLATTHPWLAKEWHPTKNEPYTPKNVTRGFNKQKIWWKCEKGHEFESTVASRTGYNLGCPYCSGRYAISGETDLSTINPDLAKEWDYEKNKSVTPDMVKIGTHKKVWWKCHKGHSYQASVHSRTNMNSSCPICAKELQTSFPEKAIAFYLSKIGLEIVENYRSEWLKKNELDIYIPSIKLAVEYDGQAWHKNGSKDLKKDILCLSNGVNLIHIREPKCPKISGIGHCYTLEDTKEKSLNKVIEFLYDVLVDEYNIKIPQITVDVEKDRFKIYELIELNDKQNSFATLFPELSLEWNYEKNEKLTPYMVTAGSSKKVWWKCKNGHEWETSVVNRTKGIGCPYCSGKRILTGYNDLQTLHPQLSLEWNGVLNEDLKPNEISPGSHKKVWWKCNVCGNEWLAEIKSRTRGNGCPECGIKKRNQSKSTPKPGKSLAEKYPKLALEWHPTKNEMITAWDVHPGSHKHFWWIGKCGHEWDASIASRVRGEKCPYCAGKRILQGFNDLRTTHPHIAEQWDFEKNQEQPTEVTHGSSKLAWWKCKVCHHNYQKTISQKVQYPKCPNCNN